MGSPVEVLREAIEALVALEPGQLADGETLVELHRELARLDAVTTRATGVWDANKVWAAEGARTGAAWLAVRCRVPDGQARRRLRLGRAVRELPQAEAAWLAGDVESSHVAALAGARSEHTAEAMGRDEAALVEIATTGRFSRFQRRLAYWQQEADPDGEERRYARHLEDRRVHLSATFQGAWALDGLLDPISGTIVDNALSRVEQQLFEADWADAKRRLGRDPLAHELDRTAGQRRADALVELAIRAMTAPERGRRPEALFTVLVGYETFAGRVCELANRTVITPGALVPWLDHAWIERVVFDSPSRVLDVGVRRRFFTGATKRAAQVVGQECFDDFCDEPAERCEIDHIQPASHGGPTTQTNGRPACSFHNRNRHRRPPAA